MIKLYTTDDSFFAIVDNYLIIDFDKQLFLLYDNKDTKNVKSREIILKNIFARMFDDLLIMLQNKRSIIELLDLQLILVNFIVNEIDINELFKQSKNKLLEKQLEHSSIIGVTYVC